MSTTTLYKYTTRIAGWSAVLFCAFAIYMLISGFADTANYYNRSRRLRNSIANSTYVYNGDEVVFSGVWLKKVITNNTVMYDSTGYTARYVLWCGPTPRTGGDAETSVKLKNLSNALDVDSLNKSICAKYAGVEK